MNLVTDTPDAMIAAKRRRATRIWLIVATTLYVLASPVIVMMAGMSVMSFDAPGSENNPATKLFVLSLLTSPVTVIGSLPLAWTLFYFRKHAASLWAIALPFANLLLLIIAFVWLEVRYGGQFSGQ